jgi:hypothetical protein
MTEKKTCMTKNMYACLKKTIFMTECQALSVKISSCEMIAASVENANGHKLSIVSAYCPASNCRLNSDEVGDALKELGTP